MNKDSAIKDSMIDKSRAGILIIDDTPANLQLLYNILTEEGYSVRPADNGPLGLESVAAEAPDLILLDIRMPGMDGFEVFKRLKSGDHSRNIPVIFISAMDDMENKTKGFSLGAVDYITKPFDPREVLARVATHLTIRKTQAGLESANTRLREAGEKIKRLNADLEERVKRRTRELENANIALYKSEEKYRRLFENSVFGFFQSTPEGRFTMVNPAFAAMLGYESPDDFFTCSEDVSTRFYTNKHDRNRFQQVIRTRECAENFEFMAKCKDGSRIWLSSSTRSYFSSDGKVMHFEGVVVDITDRKRMEEENKKLFEQFHRMQKMDSLGTLAGGIAHDFNNILSPLLGYAQILEEDIPPDNPLYEYNAEILKAALRARDLVKQILTFSRQGDHGIKPVKLQPVIMEVVKLLSTTIPRTIEIRTELDAGCGEVAADPTRIHQIVMNLAVNAYHAMEESGGLLKLVLEQCVIEPPEAGMQEAGTPEAGTPEAETQEAGTQEAGTQEMMPGEYALIKVADTGGGIDKEILDRIFDPYFTTKERGKGTGLGLSITRDIVKNYNGTVRLRSEPGKGTEVRVYLPVLKTVPDNNEAEKAPRIQGGTERILLVDDEESILGIEKNILERLGYRVSVTASSIGALEMFRSGPENFDLVVTDFMMPDMTGTELARAIRTVSPHIPIIICTGDSGKIDGVSNDQLGIQARLVKPIVKATFARTVRTVLDGPDLSDRNE